MLPRPLLAVQLSTLIVSLSGARVKPRFHRDDSRKLRGGRQGLACRDVVTTAFGSCEEANGGPQRIIRCYGSAKAGHERVSPRDSSARPSGVALTWQPRQVVPSGPGFGGVDKRPLPDASSKYRETLPWMRCKYLSTFRCLPTRSTLLRIHPAIRRANEPAISRRREFADAISSNLEVLPGHFW